MNALQRNALPADAFLANDRMKNYRVWQANREIFLWPENWMEESLRDDKTPLFKALENELLQNDLNDSNAQDAIIHYLEGLNQIARLEICGMYHDLRWNSDFSAYAVDTMHVFGRTYGGTPRIYYYCKWDNLNGFWTPWKKIDLDIDSEHICPIIYEGRLFLFWSIFTKQADQGPLTMPPAGGSMENKYVRWNITIASSVYHHDKWAAKQVSQTGLTFPPWPVPETPPYKDAEALMTTYNPTNFTLRAWDCGKLFVYCYIFGKLPPPQTPPTR